VLSVFIQAFSHQSVIIGCKLRHARAHGASVCVRVCVSLNKTENFTLMWHEAVAPRRTITLATPHAVCAYARAIHACLRTCLMPIPRPPPLCLLLA
jgi:hypothetical protein